MLVFRGASADELRALAAGGSLPGPAWAATPAFLDAFGLGPGDEEDAERTALYVAALAALLEHGRRLVVVAEAPARPAAGESAEFGAVDVDPLVFAQVTALFAEDAAHRATADAVGVALAVLGLADAWGRPAHEALLEQADLLWYGPEEWAVVAGGSGA